MAEVIPSQKGSETQYYAVHHHTHHEFRAAKSVVSNKWLVVNALSLTLCVHDTAMAAEACADTPCVRRRDLK